MDPLAYGRKTGRGLPLEREEGQKPYLKRRQKRALRERKPSVRA